MSKSQIMDSLIKMSSAMLVSLEAIEDNDSRMDIVEAFLEDRQSLVDALKGLDETEDPVQQEKLFEMDIRIRDSVETWLQDSDAQIKAIQNQRRELLRAKHAKAKYTKQPASAEGYFIDRKK